METNRILKFNTSVGKEYLIEVRGPINEPIFNISNICEIISIKYDRQHYKKYTNEEKVHVRKSRSFITFLTIKGLQKFLEKQKLTTPIVKEFYTWICSYVESLKTKTLTEEVFAEHKKEEKRKIEKTKHDVSKKTSLFYLTKIKDISETSFVLKFGVSADIKQRVYEHSKNFGMCILLDTIELPAALHLERSIKNNANLKKYFYKEMINGKKSTETILINDKFTYDDFYSIVKKCSNDFMDYTEKEKYEFIKEKNKSDIIKLLNEYNTKIFSNDNEKNAFLFIITKLLEESEIPKDIPEPDVELLTDPIAIEITTPQVGPKQRKASRGNKIQQYDPTDHTKLIATYEGFTDASRHIPTSSSKGIQDACDHKTIYRGFRWHEISRDTPDATIFDIGDNVENVQQYKGYIALVNYDANKILNVFPNQKVAGEELRLSASTIAANIKRGSKCSGGHLMKYDDIPEELKIEYLKTNNLPDIFENKGTPIHQYDPKTKALVKTWNNVNAVLRAMKIARATLYDACEHGHTVKEFLWKKNKIEY